MKVHYPYVEVCNYCGSPRIQWTCWYEANTEEVVDHDGPLETGYCPTCAQNDHDGEMSRSCSFDLGDPHMLCTSCYGGKRRHVVELRAYAVGDMLEMTRRLIYEFTDVEYTP